MRLELRILLSLFAMVALWIGLADSRALPFPFKDYDSGEDSSEPVLSPSNRIDPEKLAVIREQYPDFKSSDKNVFEAVQMQAPPESKCPNGKWMEVGEEYICVKPTKIRRTTTRRPG